MGDPKTYFFRLPTQGRPSPFRLEEVVYSKFEWFNQNRATRRTVNPIEGIEGVVIHATAGGSTAGALATWEDPNGNKASAHWIVPDEDEAGHGSTVLAVVAEALASWHVRNDKTHSKIGGRKQINHWSLGIEIVNRQIPTDDFSNWQVEMTARIVRYCWAKYPNLKYVFSHALVDPTRRSDPGSKFDWEKFTQLISSQPVRSEADPVNLALASAISALPQGSALPHCCMDA